MHARAHGHHPWEFDCMGPRGRHHHGPPPWFMHFMGPPPRAERGEVRYLILDALKDQPRHGYEVIQTIEQRSGGSYRPSPGTIYPTLQMLEEMGQVAAQRQGDKTVYAITEAGLAELAEHQDEVDDAYQRLGGGTDWFSDFDFQGMGSRLRRLMQSLKGAVRRGQLGKSELQAVAKVIDEAVERIEKILDRG
ncbi:MAG: PadR family transcriptional regulator [Pseudomonadota bacterium]